MTDWAERRNGQANTALQIDLKDYLHQTAAQYGLYDELYRVITCESQWNPFAVGDKGLAYSLLQFHKPTFDHYCVGDYYNPFDQIDCAIGMFILEEQKHWSCWRQQLAEKYN